MKKAFFFLAFCLALPYAGQAESLPARLLPPAPFPLVLSQAFDQEEIALGVHLGRYYLMTNAGPLVIHALCINPGEPSLRLDTVLADDHIISKGETVSSMAGRTGAIAGINADFFDIGNTYQPIGILASNGLLLHQASEPAALIVSKNHAVRFEHFDTLNAAFLAPDVQSAIGGGPQLLRNGLPYDDPQPPSPREALRRNPLSAALRRSDGTLVLVQVDGREHGISIGLTRPELTALLRAFGGIDGMGFDGGGSSTIVARLPGELAASVQNTPSDGRERMVSDGLFVYSSAPIGPPAHLAVRPGTIRILQGAQTTLNIFLTDAAGHALNGLSGPIRAEIRPPTLATMFPDRRLLAGARPGTGMLHLQNANASLSADIPVEVVDRIASVRIEPEYPNPQPGESIFFHAFAYNQAGAPIEVGQGLSWEAQGGPIGKNGAYRASTQDSVIIARVPGAQARRTVRVGRRTLPIDLFRHDGPAAHSWTFAAMPPGGSGSAELDSDDALALSYDFSAGERAAFANTNVQLDGALLTLQVDIEGNDSGVAVRTAVTNLDGDRIPVTLAAHIDWQGWRTLSVALPHAALEPQTLEGFYVVAPRINSSAAGSGTIALRNLRGIFAGTTTPIPPYHLRPTPISNP